MALFALAVATAGCGAGGAGRSGPVPGAGPASPNSAKQAVTFKIVIPTGKGSKSAVRRPRYVSPATTQLAINIQTGCPGSCSSVAGYPTTVSLTPTSTGCTSTLASTQCQLILQLAPGNYTLTLTTEDAQNQALSTAANVAVSVVAGANNAISVTLSGIPVEILATVLNATANTILVEALDADGNPITGPGAPTFSAARASGISLGLVQPTTSSPNEFRAVPASTGVASLTVTASFPAAGATNACTETNAVCSASFNLSAGSAVSSLFAVNRNNNYTVVEYAAPYTGAPVATITSGLDDPQQVAFDSLGNLYVANNETGRGGCCGDLTEYAPPYTGAATHISNANVIIPIGIAFDAGNDLFVPLSQIRGIVELAPPYTGNPVATLLSGHTIPDLVFDKNANMFVSNRALGEVDKYAPPYTGSPAVLQQSFDSPGGLAFDSSGNLFIASDSDNAVYEFSPPYTGSPAARISSGVASPGAVAFDPSNNLYVGNGSDTITVYAPPYTGSPTATVSNGISGLNGIAIHTAYPISISAQ